MTAQRGLSLQVVGRKRWLLASPRHYAGFYVLPPTLTIPTPGTVLGAQEIFATVNLYQKYYLGPDNILEVGIVRAGAPEHAPLGQAVRPAVAG
jgi:hypothetical protein